MTDTTNGTTTQEAITWVEVVAWEKATPGSDATMISDMETGETLTAAMLDKAISYLDRETGPICGLSVYVYRGDAEERSEAEEITTRGYAREFVADVKPDIMRRLSDDSIAIS